MMAEPLTFDGILKIVNAMKVETMPADLERMLPAIYAAKLLEPEVEALFNAAKKKTGVKVSAFRSAWQTYLATRDVVVKQEAATAPVTPEVEKAALALLHAPDLLAQAISTIGCLGVVGERANRGLLYLGLTSRLMPEPISTLIKGRSAGGKSNLVKQALKLTPPESYYEFTAMSAKALIYAEELELKHKHLIIYEEDGNEEAEYLVRSLLSEGKISYLTAEKGAKGITSRHIEREGPTGLITTLTRAKVREDNETRAWSMYVDDSKDQTLKVVAALADAAATGKQTGLDTRPWQVAQRKLEPLEVLLSFAPVLAELLKAEGLPSDTTRLRRDFGRLLTLVKVITLLYQYQREKTGAGQLVATLDDYHMAYDLVAAPFAQSSRDLSPQALKLAKAAHEVYNARPEDKDEYGQRPKKSPVTPRELEGRLRWSRPTVLKWLGQAEAAGLVEVETGKGNKATSITPVGAVPDEALELLPKPEAVLEHLQKNFLRTSGNKFNAKDDIPPETAKPALNHLKTALTALNPETEGDLNAVNGALSSLNAADAVTDAKEAEKSFAFNRLADKGEKKKVVPWDEV